MPFLFIKERVRRNHLEKKIPIYKPSRVPQTHKFQDFWELNNEQNQNLTNDRDKANDDFDVNSETSTNNYKCIFLTSGTEFTAPTTVDDNQIATRAPPP